MSDPFPLSTPDLERMPLIERELAQRAPADGELRRRVDELKQRYDEAYEREEKARELAAELEEARREFNAATAAALDNATWHLRNEWLQLQVLRSFMPQCVVCRSGVGPVHLLIGSSAERLCLDCFDAWADPDLEAMEDTSASLDVDRLAEEARSRESARRQAQVEAEGPQLRVVGAGEIPQEADTAQRCWHCGGSAERRPEGDERWSSARIALQVAALVPHASQPEEGLVCLACLDWEAGGVDWLALRADLSDVGRREKIKAEAARRRQAEQSE